MGSKESQMLTEIATKEGTTKRGVVDALVSEYYREFHSAPISQREQTGPQLQGLQESRSYEPSGGPTHTTFQNESRQEANTGREKPANDNVVFDL